jgi:hypothetical protein
VEKFSVAFDKMIAALQEKSALVLAV